MFYIKNQKKILKFEIFSIIFVSILGIILHFAFDWSNGTPVVGPFSAVNESTWEHLKLLFYPMLLSTIIGYFYLSKNTRGFLCARIFAVLTSLLFTVVVFYTYTGILGTNFAFLNIALFIFAVLVGEYVSYRLMLASFNCVNSKAFILFAIFIFLFTLFTFFPPQIGLFKDPVNNSYGIAHLTKTSILL